MSLSHTSIVSEMTASRHRSMFSEVVEECQMFNCQHKQETRQVVVTIQQR